MFGVKEVMFGDEMTFNGVMNSSTFAAAFGKKEKRYKKRTKRINKKESPVLSDYADSIGRDRDI